MTAIKYCFTDIETTGVDVDLHHVWQIACIITDSDLNVLDRFEIKFRPIDVIHASSSALEKTRMTHTSLMALPVTHQQAFKRFTAFLEKHCNRYDKWDKLQFIAYRADFDFDFLRKFWDHNGDDYFGAFFWNPCICVMQQCAFLLRNDRAKLESFKLQSLCQFAGIPWDDDRAHDGEYDIEQTLELARKVF